MTEIMEPAVENTDAKAVGDEESPACSTMGAAVDRRSLERAISIAVVAHKGQVDKAGAPYILHPLRVMFQMTTELEMAAAVLHDVIEDTDTSLDDLKMQGFSHQVLETIESVTRREGETYEDFVTRAGLHPVGAIIKSADILDNMNISRIASLSEKDLKRIEKYHRSLALLKELQVIRKEPMEVRYYKKGGNVQTAVVELVPRGLPYPNALNAYGAAGTIIVHFAGVMGEAVMPEDYLTIRKILKAKDPALLYGYNPFWAPFFCPECRGCYPYAEWQMDFEAYGSCPQGHRRKMEDRQALWG